MTALSFHALHQKKRRKYWLPKASKNGPQLHSCSVIYELPTAKIYRSLLEQLESMLTPPGQLNIRFFHQCCFLRSWSMHSTFHNSRWPSDKFQTSPLYLLCFALDSTLTKPPKSGNKFKAALNDSSCSFKSFDAHASDYPLWVIPSTNVAHWSHNPLLCIKYIHLHYPAFSKKELPEK